MNQQQNILFVNMASGYGGGEVQTEELIKYSSQSYTCYLLARRKSKLAQSLVDKNIRVQVLNFWQSLLLLWRTPNIVLHAQDGRSAHIVHLLHKLSTKPYLITRHVYKAFKRKSSTKAYQQANALVGVSQQITHRLKELNAKVHTIYGCIKPSQEDAAFEKKYFAQSKERLRIAHVGNLQEIKNHHLTIELAKHFPTIDFYIVGSGELEQTLKQQAQGLINVFFIPFTPFVGSVFKNVDLQILPSHLEGFGGVILEGYQYHVPILAHKIGGIPEIVEDGKTGFLIEGNALEAYKSILKQVLSGEISLEVLQSEIKRFNQEHDFSAQRMGEEYSAIYQSLLK